MTAGLEPSALLRAGLQQLSVNDPERVQQRAETFLDELERWNPRFGLVKFTDRRELVVKHVLDSLAGWRAVADAVPAAGGTVLDVGSGAGFPGIPLSAAMPGTSFTLLERMARRVSFLKTCAVLLGLPRLGVVQADLTEAEGDYDVVTFRAVAPLGRFLDDIEKSRIRWRTIVAYKGREDRAQEELDDIRRSRATGWDFTLVALQPPFMEEERCLIVAKRMLTNQ
jgi:16S rRNA (guanine527-N7)-methyltransferase